MQKLATLLVVSALAGAASAQGFFKSKDPFRAEIGLYVPTFPDRVDGLHVGKSLGVNVGLGYSFLRGKTLDLALVARGDFYHLNVGGLGVDASLGTYGVDARYQPLGKRFFVGVGLTAAQIRADSHGFNLADTTKLGYSVEAGYDLTKKLYGVVRFQDTTDGDIRAYRGVTVGVGYRF